MASSRSTLGRSRASALTARRTLRVFCLLSLGYTAGFEQAFEPVTFVHIPKTGGTSIRHALVEAGCHAMRVPRTAQAHLLTAAAATQNGRRCILVLREPTDRFVSAYSYFMSFNEAIATRAREGHPTSLRVRHPSFPTVGSLIDATGAHNADTRFMDSTIFAPQSKWVNVQDFERTTVVCYDERLSERAASAISRVTSPPCNVTIPRINVAARPDSEALLNETHRAWLRKRYARDYALWEEHCGPGHDPPQTRERRHSAT